MRHRLDPQQPHRAPADRLTRPSTTRRHRPAGAAQIDEQLLRKRRRRRSPTRIGGARAAEAPPRRGRSWCGPAGSAPARRSIMPWRRSARSTMSRIASDAAASGSAAPSASTNRARAHAISPAWRWTWRSSSGREALAMRHHQEAAAGARNQIARQAASPRPAVSSSRLPVELVGEQQQRLRRQCAADGDALLLAAGQAARDSASACVPRPSRSISSALPRRHRACPAMRDWNARLSTTLSDWGSG